MCLTNCFPLWLITSITRRDFYFYTALLLFESAKRILVTQVIVSKTYSECEKYAKKYKKVYWDKKNYVCNSLPSRTFSFLFLCLRGQIY